jgi:hypothetical protein
MSSTNKVSLKTWKELYEEEKYKNDMLNNILMEYNLESIDDLIEIVDNHVNKKYDAIPVQDTNNIIQIEKDKEIINKENEELKKEKRKTIYYDASEDIKDNNVVRLTEEINKLSKIIEENQINHKKEVEDLKNHYDVIISDLKNKDKVPLPTPSNSNEKQKNTQSRVPDFEKSKTYKIIILDNPDTKVKQKIGRRTYEFLNFYKELMDLDKIESNYNFNSLNDCTEYILKSKGLPLSKQNKSNWKRNIIRCNEIFNLFKDKLINVYYNINNIRYIKDEYWEQWKTYVGNKIDEFYNSTPNKNDTS